VSEVNGQRMPSGWVTARLSDVATVVMGQSPPSSTYNYDGNGLPFFQGKAEFGSLYPEVRVWCTKPNKIAHMNDILLSVRAPVGPTNLVPAKCCIGRGLAAVRPENELNLKYLLHVFRHFSKELDAKGTGTTFKAVSGNMVRDFTVPIAPVSEQSRIADALDELFSDLDAGVAGLQRVRDKLELYRASVLKAAVEGALTAEWRKQYPHIEPASELLKRILAERRRRWEEEQLRRFKGKGQEPPRNWKHKYREPVGPDINNLPALPEGWCWATMEQLAWSAGYGTSEKCREAILVWWCCESQISLLADSTLKTSNLRRLRILNVKKISSTSATYWLFGQMAAEI
jgi:type I restriction enzyme, S subunit